MRAGQPNLGKEWEQVPAVDCGGGGGGLMSEQWPQQVSSGSKSKSVSTKARVQRSQNRMNTIGPTSEILGNYAKILKYDKYCHGHSLIAVLSQVWNKNLKH